MADWESDLPEAAILIQRFQPDQYFTEAQYQRMPDLLSRRASLAADERAELETLVDAELDATVLRVRAMSRTSPP